MEVAGRRRFCTALLGAGLAASPVARAATSSPWTSAGAPVEGVHYQRLATPIPVATPGRREVIEFFWYECPFCNAFEPALEAWVAKLASGVAFRRVPVWFRPEPFATQQRLFYAMQSLGLEARLHRRIFAAIHESRARLRTPEDIAAFMLLNGVEPIGFMKAFASPETQQLAEAARMLTQAGEVRDVPALLVDGRFFITGASASTDAKQASNERMLDVADALLRQRRGGR